MNIAVLGAGNAGTAVAADLSLRAHEVRLIKTSRHGHTEHFRMLQDHGGQVELVSGNRCRLARIAQVTDDLAAVSGCAVVIVYVQTNYHEDLIQRLKPWLGDGQLLLFNPGYLSTAYVLRHLGHLDLIVAEAESSFIDCRISRPGQVRIGFRNVRNPIGIFPARRREDGRRLLYKLGFPFTWLDSVVEAALHNPNLIVHTVGAIMSMPRIEKTGGDYCMYHEVFTPSVWKILEALDAEKMDVLEALGFARLPYAEACRFRNTLDLKADARATFQWYAAMPERARGPVTVDSRYITEDVPEGLVLLETLGQALSLPTPVTTALIEIASAALGRDFRAGGRTVARLGARQIARILADHGKDSDAFLTEPAVS
ncbi:MAG: NAD/NADP octopine/nopaline dehydrogenase family protein [Clostridiales bacterium]|nr:NAD/NADP octopine/nopaline dehydrogenase family protein [Clostridiales bacterium]